MESCDKLKISSPIRTKKSVKEKFKNRQQNEGRANSRRKQGMEGKALSTDECSKQMRKVLTEFDEAERLCLPNYSFAQTECSEIIQNFPKHYNVKEYQKMTAAVDRRRYRNSKDLRHNHKNYTDAPQLVEQSEHRLCYTQLRGEKCLDFTCLFKHEFRLPRRLRLCNEWKKGSCADAHFCLYLHSEFPCRFHYLGLKKLRHDPKTCRFYHGGPLPKEYEEMFLSSIDATRFPLFREMYKNRRIQLEATAGNSTILEQKTDTTDHRSTEMQQIDKCSITAVESGNIIGSVIDNERNVCPQEDPDSSDENRLQMDEKTLD